MVRRQDGPGRGEASNGHGWAGAASLVALAATIAAGALAPAAAQQTAAKPAAEIAFVGADGAAIGKADLLETSEGLLIELDIAGLSPGEHAIHIHAVGKCDPADKFESAGGHLARADQEHGYRHEKGPHAGDLPNLFVPADGALKAHIMAPGIDFADPGVKDSDGAALVIHAGPDDYMSQPSGDSGGRIACAVLVQP